MKKNLLSRYNRRRLAWKYLRKKRSVRKNTRKQFVVWDIIWEPPQILVVTASAQQEEGSAIKKHIATSNY